MDLCVGDCDLECPAIGEANNDLITDPLSGRRLRIHGVEESTSNRAQCSSKNPKERNNADLHECESLDNSGYSQRDDERKHSDAGSDGTGVMNALEIDRQVIEYDKV